MSSRWMVGDVEIVRVDSANFVLPSTSPMPEWAAPAFVPSVNEVPVAFSAIVIRVDGITAVVDPWIVDDAPRAAANASEVIDGLLAQLSAIGVEADEVGYVVNTHIDGIGWNTRPAGDGWAPTFPNARYLLPADELAAIDGGTPINGSEHLGPLRDAELLEAFDPPFEVAPGVTLVDAPGHNYGHVAVRVDRDDALAIYPGHLVLSLMQIDDPGCDLADSDLEVASDSRRRILGELARRDGVLLTTLIGGPGGGRVRSRGDGYELIPVTDVGS